VQILSTSAANSIEELWNEVEITFCGPQALAGQSTLRRFIGFPSFGYAIA
jgi:hypothetical protein